MFLDAIKRQLPVWDTRQLQTNHIVMITFWSQFSVYALNTVLILFLTRPLLAHGLGYSQLKTLLDKHFPMHGHWKGLGLGHIVQVWLWLHNPHTQ